MAEIENVAGIGVSEAVEDLFRLGGNDFRCGEQDVRIKVALQADLVADAAAGGQDHLKGKIFRISHMGYIDSFDVITALAAVEMVIKGLGYPIKLGSGVAKAQEIIMGKS